MKRIRSWRIELLRCEVKDNAKGTEAAGNHGPSAGQSSTTQQRAVEVLEHTHTFSHMINTENIHAVALNERISTLQK